VIHLQNIIDAIGAGSIFALIAVGIGLVFGVLRLINFAYGQLIMLAAYTLAFTDSWPDALSILLAVSPWRRRWRWSASRSGRCGRPIPRRCSSRRSRSRTCSRTPR
jgi:hypothetical protein